MSDRGSAVANVLLAVAFVLPSFTLADDQRNHMAVSGYKLFDGNCQGGLLREIGRPMTALACAAMCDIEKDNCLGFSHDGAERCFLKTIPGCSNPIEGSIFKFYQKQG